MVITVASGKGGTGKTTISTSLSISVSKHRTVSHVDLDVEEPDSNIFLKVPIEREEMIWLPLPVIDYKKCTFCGVCQRVCEYNAIFVFKNTGEVKVFDQLCRGCGACKEMCPYDAIYEVQRFIGVFGYGKKGNLNFYEGRLNIGEYVTTDAIRWVKRRLKEINNSEVTIIDAPPGTSCPVIHSMKDADFVLLVTEDTPFGLFDMKLAYGVAKKMNKKLGIVINKALPGFTETREFAKKENIPVLLEIPFDRKFARAYAEGITLSEYSDEFSEKFERIFSYIEKEVQNA